MSTTITAGVTTYSIQSAKPTTVYGQLAQQPIANGASGVLFQASLSKIPRNATIVDARFRFYTYKATSGTRTPRIYRTSKWPAKVTWAKRPSFTLVASGSVSSPGNGAAVDVVVTSAIQQMVKGTLSNLGWFLQVAESSAMRVRGSKASAGRPVLIVKYTVPPPAPTSLEPSDAAVAVDKPTLLFNGDPSLVGLRVQVDPAANATTPAYDSGNQAATGGLWDLAETAYPGLAEAASTYWRAQQQTDGGWSPWSPWVRFTRTARAALTITSPTGGTNPVVVEDGTPPITWTFAGTQVAWRVRLLAENGDLIADSGRTAGTDTDWTPSKGLTKSGQRGLIEVTAWDNTTRSASPGSPAESIVTREIVLTPSSALEAFTATSAANGGMSPVVTVTGRRSAIPDAVVLLRDGAEIGRWPGTDVMVPAPSGGGFVAAVPDRTAVMNKPAVYALAPVVNAKRGPAGTTYQHVPRCRGIWLTSHETGLSVPLWGGGAAEQSQPEVAVVHRPIGGNTDDEVPVVRRRLIRAAPEGSISGELMDVGPYLAEDAERTLREWAEEDAGDRYTLVLGGYTGTVIIGDLTFVEINNTPGNGRRLAVSLSWWQA